MKYVIEDTYNGFRLTMLDSKSGKPRHRFEESGHGPVEGLYAQAQALWSQLRSAQSKEKRLALWVGRAETQGWMDARGAASWVTDGNESDESRERKLKMIEGGDPQVLEYLPRSPNLSGEWADHWTPDKLVREVTGLDPEHLSDEEREAIVQAYEEKVADEFELACAHALNVALGKV